MRVLRSEIGENALRKIYADSKALRDFKKQRRLGKDVITVITSKGEKITIGRSQARLKSLARKRGLIR